MRRQINLELFDQQLLVGIQFCVASVAAPFAWAGASDSMPLGIMPSTITMAGAGSCTASRSTVSRWMRHPEDVYRVEKHNASLAIDAPYHPYKEAITS